MKKYTPIIIIIALILVLCGALSVFAVFKSNQANDERVSAVEVFPECPDGRLLIYYNHGLADPLGVYDSSRAYVPLDWVCENINDIFYYDSEASAILYTLPDELVTLGSDELYMRQTEPYISLDAVLEYSDISASSQLGGEVNRVYIYDNDTSYISGNICEDTVLRTGESIKEPGIVDIAAGTSVDILDDSAVDETEVSEDSWIYVMSQDGYSGYIPRSAIESFKETRLISDYEAPDYTHNLLNQPVLLAWHQVTSESANRYLVDVTSATSGINVISPTWFSVTGNDGSISSLASLDYVQQAHSLGMQVWALIDNFNTEISSLTLLSSTASRRNLINNLIMECEFYGIDGINIDFEMLPEDAGEPFAQFVRELSVETRKRGLILSIDNPAAAAYNLYYARDVQAQFADYVINMGYDEHYSGGEAGSVASLPFELESLQLTLEEVPAAQIISGIPLYTRIWTVSGASTDSRAVGLSEAAKWVEENEITLTWDETLCQYAGEKNNGSSKDLIWLEDNDSLQLKANLAKDMDLGGIACWKLGLDNPEAWEVIKY